MFTTCFFINPVCNTVKFWNFEKLSTLRIFRGIIDRSCCCYCWKPHVCYCTSHRTLCVLRGKRERASVSAPRARDKTFVACIACSFTVELSSLIWPAFVALRSLWYIGSSCKTTQTNFEKLQKAYDRHYGGGGMGGSVALSASHARGKIERFLGFWESLSAEKFDATRSIVTAVRVQAHRISSAMSISNSSIDVIGFRPVLIDVTWNSS